MAIIPCNCCGRPISDKAESCPNCGHPNSRPTVIQKPHGKPTVIYRQSVARKSNNWIWILVAFAVGIGIGLAIWIPMIYHDNSHDNSHNSSSTNYTSTENKSYYHGKVNNKAKDKLNKKETDNLSNSKNKIPRQRIDASTAIDLITGYHNSIYNGNSASYLEDDGIDFFSLKNVDKETVLKHIKKASQKNSEHDYDWATLQIIPLSSGNTKVLFESDYYIYYETRTDKYRLKSEFIFSPDLKIKSIKDLETNKVASYN